MSFIKLMYGDCLEKMKSVPDNSVDMILCDLPYGTTTCAWDSIIPLPQLWEAYNRVAKEKAAIVLTSSQPFTTKLIASNYDMFRYCWVWHKTRPSNFPLAKKQPMKYHEDVCVFGRKTPNYYPIMIHGEGKIRKKGKNEGYRGFNKGLEDPAYLEKEYTDFYPGTIQTFPHHNGGMLHPTQKPVALMEYMIQTYSLKGDVVLDNTMGSGTTGVACRKLGRSFIGIEMDKEYYKIAVKRIKETKPND